MWNFENGRGQINEIEKWNYLLIGFVAEMLYGYYFKKFFRANSLTKKFSTYIL